MAHLLCDRMDAILLRHQANGARYPFIAASDAYSIIGVGPGCVHAALQTRGSMVHLRF